MKKKVGIITLNGNFNYGNRLQNFALQKVLQSLDCEVDTILIENKTKKQSLLKRVLRKFIRLFSHTKNVNTVNEKRLKALRTERFKQFSNSHIIETDYSISDDYLPTNILNSYAYFITGSDQVWNPEYNYESPLYFLTFAPDYKRISYAASFGITELTNEIIENYKQWLSEMKYISVREEAGRELVKKLTGRDAQVVLDPTLLLTKEQWLSVKKVAKNKPKKSFLLTYFLGGITLDIEDEIKRIAKEKNLEIVNLAKITDEKAFIADPAEFLDYINSSDIFLTDSFHGSVFSILFEKPFIVFERMGTKKSMSSRIDTLLATFELTNRKWNNINKDNIDIINFSHIQPLLKKEREESLRFLQESIQ